MLPAPAAGPHLLSADYSLHGLATVLECAGVIVLGVQIPGQLLSYWGADTCAA